MTKDVAVKKFEQFINSSISSVFNWCWQSGLAILVITLIYSNLKEQRLTHDIVLKVQAKYIVLDYSQGHLSTSVAQMEGVQMVYEGRLDKIEREHAIHSKVREIEDRRREGLTQ